VSKRVAMTAFLLAVLAGVLTGLRSAREPRGPPQGPWLDSQGMLVPDGTNREQGFPLTLHVFQGVEHCDWQSVTFLSLAWPLGRVTRPPYRQSEYRQYARDPERALLPAFRLKRFESDVALPGDARPTGYHRDSWELWLSPSQSNRFVYLVHGERAERWPRAGIEVACK
jgi:hypothetical protein